jgi:hypothetical protein
MGLMKYIYIFWSEFNAVFIENFANSLLPTVTAEFWGTFLNTCEYTFGII